MSASEPKGLAAITSFDRLPYFKVDTAGGGFSSTDPAAGNSDNNNFRYTDATGDKVMLDMVGPGTVYRIWVTGFDQPTTYIKIYLDGVPVPQINMLMKNFFAGTNAPFLAPLVGNDQVSSGGFYCYLPFPFAKSIRITTNGATGNEWFYYNVGYHVYTSDAVINTWTGSEDSTAARDLWNQAGIDPKSTAGNTVGSTALDIAAAAAPTLQNITGPASVNSLKIHIGSGLDAPPPPVLDGGRAFTGFSQFTMVLDPSNIGARITRRLDYGIGNQHASVYVNGSYVGDWITSGVDDTTHRWRERSFNIPASFTVGKSSVTVKVKFVSSDVDWNEFYYWMYSVVHSNTSTTFVLTDQLDVGNASSESSHNYVISSQTFVGTRNFSYPQLSSVSDGGRANKGYSQFTMALNPSNGGAILTRRLDYGIGNQSADVCVDGALVGQWTTPGSNAVSHWLDGGFNIPSRFTAGKSSVTVMISFVSSDIDWNEFYYWMYSIVGNSNILTDQLDVGNAASESAHGYFDVGETWSGTRTFNYPGTNTITDDGRANKGYSQFVMALNPYNSGAVLRRRLDYGIADQAANLYVDGSLVGQWTVPGSDSINRWRESGFSIPASFTAGKSSITVKISFVSSSVDWNDFYFWMYSVVNGSNQLTDQIDVGDTSSETAHSYTINGQTFEGQRTFNYPDFITSMNNTWLKVYWDNQSVPSIWAPLSSFFAIGQFAPSSARSLAVGMDESNMMYIYFPMPFQSNGKVELVNQTGSLLGYVYCELAHEPFTNPFQNVGYFSTAYNTQLPTTANKDMVYLDTEGAGTLIGVVYSVSGPPSRGYLEGNERILVDANQSPSYSGTGTEDFFNGGWYFDQGPFTLPMHGNTAHVITGTADATSAYRLFLQDAVPFLKHIRVSMQHGGVDDVSANSWLLAYYYYQSQDRLALSDSITIGDATSEANHSYSITNPTWNGSRTYTFEGEFNVISTSATGRAHKGTSTFTMAIPPANAGVVLRRQFDQSIGNQEASVYVNDVFVGNWYRAGNNPDHSWRQDDFLIPASFTSGLSKITITIMFVSSAVDWNEFYYFAYAK